jgi:hypothetical protein
LLQTKLVCYKLTKATLRASLSSSLLQKCDGGNAPLLALGRRRRVHVAEYSADSEVRS